MRIGNPMRRLSFRRRVSTLIAAFHRDHCKLLCFFNACFDGSSEVAPPPRYRAPAGAISNLNPQAWARQDVMEILITNK